MPSPYKKILFSVLGLFLVLLAVRLLWPDGLITLDFRNAPISKVIASIERQGRVRIATNVPPETPVTMQMKKVPLMEALETLAVRAEGDLRVVVAAAPTSIAARSALEDLKTGTPSDQWTVAWFPGMGFGPTPADPRQLLVTPEPTGKNDLQSALQQVAAKSGLMTAVPKDWNPNVTLPSKPTPASTLARNIIQAAGGSAQESFLIIARPPGQDGGGWREAGGPRWNRDGSNPEWMAQRTQAAIAMLPPAERQVAQADFDSMRKLWEEVRALPEEQRRPKMEEFFSRPEIQEKLEERMAARDARRSPEQRAQRYKQYIQRKQQAAAGKSS